MAGALAIGRSSSGTGPTLVTGGAGFIGSHLTRALLRRGPVRVVDDLSTGKATNLAGTAAELHQGSILDEALLRDAMRGVTAVVHLAAMVSVARSVEDPARNHDVNATGTLRVLEAARQAGVQRVVLASSAAVYGDAPALPAREDAVPAPRSPYAAAKLAAEHYGQAYTHSLGVEAVSLRFFNVYGPGQDPASAYAAAIPLFFAAARAGKPIPVIGDGLQTRDFVHVSDVVDAIVRTMQSPGAAGQVLNVCTGEAVTVLELAQTIARLVGSKAAPRHVAPRPGEVRHSRGDPARAQRVLGWKAAVPLADGLAPMVAA